jgi:hypothetical protein
MHNIHRDGRTEAWKDVSRCAAIIFAILVAASPAVAKPDGLGLAKLTPAERRRQQVVDLNSLVTCRAGLSRTVGFARTHPELYPASPPSSAQLLTADQRDAVRATWKSLLGFTLALDSLERFHVDFCKVTDADERARSFHAASGAFRAAYRFALDFIALVENDPKLGLILNDAMGDLGLPSGTYDRYKFRFLSFAAATRFAAYVLAGQALGPSEAVLLSRAAEEDTARIREMGRGRGEELTAANSFNVLRQRGKTQLLRRRGCAPLGHLPREPGGELERLLEHSFPAARAATLLPPEQGHAQRVLEVISEGVVFTTLEHSAAADSVVVLRPRLSRLAIASAIERAWGYAGRPYDFNFDFQTDSALVCTELICKAFEASRETPGLRLALEEILGRTAIPANAIARQFDTEFGTPAAQFDLVAFLDAQEKAGVAVEAGVEEFRKSWRRPKWHVLVQEAVGGGAAPI